MTTPSITSLPRDDRDRPVGEDGRRETPNEKLDRNWNELLQELRVTQTGTQILTGFLLTVPFQGRFGELNHDQRMFYLGLVFMSAVTTGIMVAPVSLHRWLFRKGAKSTLVASGDRLLRVGLVSLALVVAGVVLLVFDVVATRTASLLAAGALFALLITGWFVMPAVLARRAPPPDHGHTPQTRPGHGDGSERPSGAGRSAGAGDAGRADGGARATARATEVTGGDRTAADHEPGAGGRTPGA